MKKTEKSNYRINSLTEIIVAVRRCNLPMKRLVTF